jgi:hypothetical protein
MGRHAHRVSGSGVRFIGRIARRPCLFDNVDEVAAPGKDCHLTSGNGTDGGTC